MEVNYFRFLRQTTWSLLKPIRVDLDFVMVDTHIPRKLIKRTGYVGNVALENQQ